MPLSSLPPLSVTAIVTVGRLSKSARGERFPDLINDDFDVLDLRVVRPEDKLLFLQRPEVEGVLLERGRRWSTLRQVRGRGSILPLPLASLRLLLPPSLASLRSTYRETRSRGRRTLGEARGGEEY